MSNPTPKLAWGHVNINVSNLDRSIAFYEKLGFQVLMRGVPYLGLTADGGAAVIPEPGAQALGLPAETSGRACIMQLDEGFPKVDLTEYSDKTQREPATNADLGIVRLCLASRDLREDYTLLRAQGIEFVSPPRPAKDGLADLAVCFDPDGTLIELIQVDLGKWSSLPRDR